MIKPYVMAALLTIRFILVVALALVSFIGIMFILGPKWFSIIFLSGLGSAILTSIFMAYLNDQKRKVK